MSVTRFITLRAVLQVLLTVVTVGSAIMAFCFAVLFKDYTNKMNENFKGELISTNLPCIRNALPECDMDREDKCWDRCCPAGYVCKRSPIVGLYCQDGTVSCGNFLWCRDYADVPGTCRTQVCQSDAMVERITVWSYIMAGFGVLLDIVDVVIFCAAPDAVVFKSVMNMASSCVKWVAFGLIVGAGTQDFMTDLYDAQCYNREGMQMTTEAGAMLIMYMFSQIFSAINSLILAPFSAYYGGKLAGVPYVK